MSVPEGNILFCFAKSPDVSWVEEPDIKCFFFVFLDFQLHFNSNKRITPANQNSRLITYNNTTLILKTTEWMIYKVLSLYYLHLFPSLASCSFPSGMTLKVVAFSLRLRVCFVLFIHEKESWQCFSRLLSHHFPQCFDHCLQQWWKSWHFLIQYAMSFIILRNLETFESSL